MPELNEYLSSLQFSWNTYGVEDPLWAIAASPNKKNNKWDLDEFFQTGSNRINDLAAWMDSNHFPRVRGHALDFGCGVGRLTQNLCQHFDMCTGVDIAPSMLEHARNFNRYPERCKYILNELPNLQIFEDNTFDLVYTEHVLQHMKPKLGVSYIRDFIRVLKPSGLAVFHVPGELATYVYPKDDFTAEIELNVPFLVMRCGESMMIQVFVKNTGSYEFGESSDGVLPLWLAYHWRSPDGEVVHSFHGQMAIPENILPGKVVEISLLVYAPTFPGHYLIEVDLADFNGVPFANRSSKHVLREAVIKPSKKCIATQCHSTETRPFMEMHSINPRVVKRAIINSGAKLVELASSKFKQGHHTSCYYYVTK